MLVQAHLYQLRPGVIHTGSAMGHSLPLPAKAVRPSLSRHTCMLAACKQSYHPGLLRWAARIDLYVIVVYMSSRVL